MSKSQAPDIEEDKTQEEGGSNDDHDNLRRTVNLELQNRVMAHTMETLAAGSLLLLLS